MNGRPAQDCGRCRQQVTCWFAGARPAQVAVSLAVCRLQRAKTTVERDRAFRALLQMIGPRLRATATWCAKRTGRSAEETYFDLQATVYERLISRFDIGTGVHPLHWLFNPRTGAVQSWVSVEASRHTKQRTRFGATALVAEEPASLLTGQLAATASFEYEELNPMLHRFASILHDGETLSVREYRVATSLLEGVHANVIARRLGITSVSVRALNATATRKLREALT